MLVKNRYVLPYLTFSGLSSLSHTHIFAGSFEIILRTSSENRFPGFIAYVICFGHALHDRLDPVVSEGEDCTTATNTTTKEIGLDKRRRRNSKVFLHMSNMYVVGILPILDEMLNSSN